MQELWANRLPDKPPGRLADVGCGLAAYDQSFPGYSSEEAMQAAYDQAIGEGAKEIRFWSSEWLIDDMGNKGNSYSGPWLTGIKVPSDVRVGAWVDDPIGDAATEAFAERLLARNVTVAALMINRSNTTSSKPPWDLRWTREQLERIGDLYHKAGIEIVCTTWPQPSKVQIEAMCADMAWVLEVTKATAFEVDTEGNWGEKFLSGFTNMNEASEYLAARMRQVAGADRALELTTFTYHQENSASAKLAPLMDRLLPQAYSVRHRNNDTVAWDDSLGPGSHQSLAMGRARQAAGA